MGEGNGNGKAPVLGCGMSVLQKKIYSWRKGSLLVYDPTFYHLCCSLFFRILDPDVFSGLRRFFGIRRNILPD